MKPDSMIAMKNTISLKILISVGLAMINLLPLYCKSLYFREGGHLTQFSGSLVIIMIFGIFRGWRILKEIIMILMGFIISLSLTHIVICLTHKDYYLAGWIINLAISVSVFILVLKLKKSERSIAA